MKVLLSIHFDAGKKVDFEKGVITGLLWKRRAIMTVIKYTDDNSEPQTIALDFIHDTKYAQPLIDRKFREVRQVSPHQDKNQPITSIADELSKLAKLKEQGVITEEEFSQLKTDLIKGNKS